MLGLFATKEARTSVILPTITCSTCGQAVKLDALADHVCGAAEPAPSLPTLSVPSPDAFPLPPQYVAAKLRKKTDSIASRAIRYPSRMSFFQKPSLAYLQMDPVEPRDSIAIQDLVSKLGQDVDPLTSFDYSSSQMSDTNTLVPASYDFNPAAAPLTIKLGRTASQGTTESIRSPALSSAGISDNTQDPPPNCGRTLRPELDLSQPLELLDRGFATHDPTRSRLRADRAPSAFSPRLNTQTSAMVNSNPYCIRLKGPRKPHMPADLAARHPSPPLTPSSAEPPASRPRISHDRLPGLPIAGVPTPPFSRSNTASSQRSDSSDSTILTTASDRSRNPNRRRRNKSGTKRRLDTFDSLLSDLMMEIQTLKTDKQLMHSSLVDERGQLVTKHCALCHKDILNTPIVLPENPNSTFYHRQCFRCADCQTLLSIRGGYRYHEERFYCIAHDPAAAPITRSCAHCHEAIAAGSEIPALDRFWHPHHLACSVCHTSAVTGNPFDFVDHQGRIFCRDDYTRLFLPKCQRCTQPVDGDALFALNAKWHPECFNCDVCHEFFPNKSFYVFENKPHCRYHYHMRNQSLCHGCQQPIEGPCAQVQEGRFHPACFTCRVCRYPLRDVYYNVDNSFYCERHAHAIQSNLPTGGLTRRRTQMRHL